MTQIFDSLRSDPELSRFLDDLAVSATALYSLSAERGQMLQSRKTLEPAFIQKFQTLRDECCEKRRKLFEAMEAKRLEVPSHVKKMRLIPFCKLYRS